jgi:phosphopantothenoylcysteine decarboxylase
MANILLVATGGTRAPTQIDLWERFVKDGHAVRLLASANALRFLASHLVRRAHKLPGFLRHYRPALQETLAYYVEKPRRVPHIAEGKWADVVVMAPATCNSVGKLAAGVSDNYPLLVLRAIPRTKKVIVVPSMNPEMWYDPCFQRSIDLLNATEKYRVLCPTRGQMLSGDWGFGAQVPFEDIVDETYRVLGILDRRTEAFLRGSRAGAVPWTGAPEEPASEAARLALVEPDAELRRGLSDALVREYKDTLEIHGFATASSALQWLRDHQVSAVFTEIDFENGASGFDLIQHLRRPGEEVQIIATSARGRREVGAERLGHLDVLFVPKPFNLSFVVGMIGGTVRTGARRRNALTTRTLEAGEVLFREGDPGTAVFIVRSGRLRITRHEGGGEAELGFADPGEMVGEMAFVDQAPRGATLTAIERTDLAVLDLESVRGALDAQPSWVRLMLQSLIGHLRETSEKVKSMRPPSV